MLRRLRRNSLRKKKSKRREGRKRRWRGHHEQRKRGTERKLSKAVTLKPEREGSSDLSTIVTKDNQRRKRLVSSRTLCQQRGVKCLKLYWDLTTQTVMTMRRMNAKNQNCASAWKKISGKWNHTASSRPPPLLRLPPHQKTPKKMPTHQNVVAVVPLIQRNQNVLQKFVPITPKLKQSAQPHPRLQNLSNYPRRKSSLLPLLSPAEFLRLLAVEPSPHQSPLLAERQLLQEKIQPARSLPRFLPPLAENLPPHHLLVEIVTPLRLLPLGERLPLRPFLNVELPVHLPAASLLPRHVRDLHPVEDPDLHLPVDPEEVHHLPGTALAAALPRQETIPGASPRHPDVVHNAALRPPDDVNAPHLLHPLGIQNEASLAHHPSGNSLLLRIKRKRVRRWLRIRRARESKGAVEVIVTLVVIVEAQVAVGKVPKVVQAAVLEVTQIEAIQMRFNNLSAFYDE
mmetsp:Transcript_438/g.602  ORF Transcript_438/g.602 Transcript_438/m.602 type:complete len:456 (+) Transcript_438:269-1636(+)